VLQPILRREGDAGLTGASSKVGRRVESPPTFIRWKCQKNQKGVCGLQTLSVKGSGVVFTHEEDISTPRVRHKGRQALIECARHDFKIMYFPFFYVFLAFYGFFLYFLSFCGRQGCFPRSYVSLIAMSKSDLRSSFRTKCWLSCFYLFSQDMF